MIVLVIYLCTHMYIYSSFFQVNDRITHRSVNIQYNSRNVFRSIKRLPLYLITKEMPSNCVQKLKNVFTFFFSFIIYMYS